MLVPCNATARNLRVYSAQAAMWLPACLVGMQIAPKRADPEP